MLPRFAQVMLLISILGTVYSCKKENSNGDPKVNANQSMVSFSLMATNTTSTLSLNAVDANATSPAINFNTGVANISRFKLEASTANQKFEVRTKKLSKIDLFAAVPSLVTAALDTGVYKQIEVKVEFIRSADRSAIPLTMTGAFTAANGNVIPVTLEFNQDLTIKAETNNITLHNNSDLLALVQLNLTKIVTGISANELNAATQTNGTIMISESSNSDLFNKIKSNLQNAAKTELHHQGKGKDDDTDDNRGNGNDDGPGHH
ncbi:MAG: hypothetical protein JKY70_18965 [Mucilaginibacter sp.]|nr:hypothetical protein [Mucilaginibacter sp.]